MQTAWSQKSKGVVQGKVKNSKTGEILPFCSITFEQDSIIKYKTETDFDGHYKIKDVTPGNYNVSVTCSEHYSKTIQGFLLKGDNVNFLDIELNPSSDKKKKNEKTRMKVRKVRH